MSTELLQPRLQPRTPDDESDIKQLQAIYLGITGMLIFTAPATIPALLETIPAPITEQTQSPPAAPVCTHQRQLGRWLLQDGAAVQADIDASSPMLGTVNMFPAYAWSVCETDTMVGFPAEYVQRVVQIDTSSDADGIVYIELDATIPPPSFVTPTKDLLVATE